MKQETKNMFWRKFKTSVAWKRQCEIGHQKNRIRKNGWETKDSLSTRKKRELEIERARPAQEARNYREDWQEKQTGRRGKWAKHPKWNSNCEWAKNPRSIYQANTDQTKIKKNTNKETGSLYLRKIKREYSLAGPIYGTRGRNNVFEGIVNNKPGNIRILLKNEGIIFWRITYMRFSKAGVMPIIDYKTDGQKIQRAFENFKRIKMCTEKKLYNNLSP